jgi:hypothetical protein
MWRTDLRGVVTDRQARHYLADHSSARTRRGAEQLSAREFYARVEQINAITPPSAEGSQDSRRRWRSLQPRTPFQGLIAARDQGFTCNCGQTFGVFKNQGDCVSFVSTRGKNPPAGG